MRQGCAISSRTALLCTRTILAPASRRSPLCNTLRLHCTVGSFHFTKYTHGMFDAVGCTGETFGDPPLPGHLERLCAETVLTLNDAMCDYYARDKQHGGCGFPEIGRTVPTCPGVEGAPAALVL